MVWWFFLVEKAVQKRGQFANLFHSSLGTKCVLSSQNRFLSKYFLIWLNKDIEWREEHLVFRRRVMGKVKWRMEEKCWWVKGLTNESSAWHLNVGRNQKPTSCCSCLGTEAEQFKWILMDALFCFFFSSLCLNMLIWPFSNINLLAYISDI